MAAAAVAGIAFGVGAASSAALNSRVDLPFTPTQLLVGTAVAGVAAISTGIVRLVGINNRALMAANVGAMLLTGAAGASAVGAAIDKRHATAAKEAAQAAEREAAIRRIATAAPAASGPEVSIDAFAGIQGIAPSTGIDGRDGWSVRTKNVIGSLTGYRTEADAWKVAEAARDDDHKGVFVVKGPESWLVTSEDVYGYWQDFDAKADYSRVMNALKIDGSPTPPEIAGYLAGNGARFERGTDNKLHLES